MSATIASPICFTDQKPCPRQGRAVLGEPRDLGGCINRTIHCLTCGATGEESVNTEHQEPADAD